MSPALRDSLAFGESHALSTLTTPTRRASHAAKGGPGAAIPRGARTST